MLNPVVLEVKTEQDCAMSLILIKRMRPGANMPQYMSELASGMDLSACIESPTQVPPGDIQKIPTGIAIRLQYGWEGQVRSRSGLAACGIIAANSPGTIDADYTGEIMALISNIGRQAFVINPGLRIAQLVICPVIRAQIVEVSELPETKRGDGGFGSTGGF